MTRVPGQSEGVEYRKLGSTGIEVSEIGYGAWGIGGSQWGGADDDESIQALNRAIDLGLDFIDTALAYGDGRSERVVGQVVRERSETHPRGHQGAAQEPDLAGAGRDSRSGRCSPATTSARAPSAASRNLGLERIDLLQLHVWSDEWTDQGDWREAVDELRSLGPDRALRRLDQRPPARQFPAADRERRGRHRPGDLQRLRPVARGRAVPGLPRARRRRDRARAARRGRADRHDRAGHRVPRRATSARTTSAATASARSTSACEAISGDLGIAARRAREMALRFVLSEPTVSTVIPGMRSARNVERNVAVSDGARTARRAGVSSCARTAGCATSTLVVAHLVEHAALRRPPRSRPRPGGHRMQRPAALADLDRPSQPRAQDHGGGAGCLVLGDPVPHREHPRAQGAGALVDPRPGADVVVAAGRTVQPLHVGGRVEALPLERRRPVGAGGDEGGAVPRSSRAARPRARAATAPGSLGPPAARRCRRSGAPRRAARRRG